MKGSRRLTRCLLRSVPIACLRHDDARAYRQEGFGGKPLEAWPVTGFFRQYLAGDQDGAREGFAAWYEDQLAKYASVPKSVGGMREGSLYRLVERRGRAPFAQVDPAIRKAAIYERVDARLAFLETIRREGYHSDPKDRIAAIRKGNSFYLLGGHHRAAALLALGAREVPEVFVFPNPLLYHAYHLTRALSHGHL